MSDRGILDLAIARLKGFSFGEKTILCDAIESEEDLARLSGRDLTALVGRSPRSARAEIEKARALAEKDERAARLRGIKWTGWRDATYPPLLREIYDPPTALFFMGSLPDCEKPLVAIVGTRKPSAQAATQAFDIARGLARSGVSVVSGLALGIDAMAHRGCMEGGAPTYAALGSGIDCIYPASNRHVARRALDTGGGIISEYPPGFPARKWTFPARNRIISGLCRGVLIAEAPEKSGALITARFALDQNRDLWVASEGVASSGGGAEDARFDRTGCRRLAQDGADIVYSASDILRMWGMEPDERSGGGLELGPGAAVSSLADSLGIAL
ncbi:MAG: DNA-processing protein DprA [Treponema sp.]|nr:DNA-processing protein DprA [Treponema sp.]